MKWLTSILRSRKISSSGEPAQSHTFLPLSLLRFTRSRPPDLPWDACLLCEMRCEGTSQRPMPDKLGPLGQKIQKVFKVWEKNKEGWLADQPQMGTSRAKWASLLQRRGRKISWRVVAARQNWRGIGGGITQKHLQFVQPQRQQKIKWTWNKKCTLK